MQTTIQKHQPKTKQALDGRGLLRLLRANATTELSLRGFERDVSAFGIQLRIAGALAVSAVFSFALLFV